MIKFDVLKQMLAVDNQNMNTYQVQNESGKGNYVCIFNLNERAVNKEYWHLP